MLPLARSDSTQGPPHKPRPSLAHYPRPTPRSRPLVENVHLEIQQGSQKNFKFLFKSRRHASQSVSESVPAPQVAGPSDAPSTPVTESIHESQTSAIPRPNSDVAPEQQAASPSQIPPQESQSESQSADQPGVESTAPAGPILDPDSGSQAAAQSIPVPGSSHSKLKIGWDLLKDGLKIAKDASSSFAPVNIPLTAILGAADLIEVCSFALQSEIVDTNSAASLQ